MDKVGYRKLISEGLRLFITKTHYAKNKTKKNN